MTTSPHDAIFKAAFERPERAASFLRTRLAEDLVGAVDWTSLSAEAASFIGPELEGRQSDLLFSARLAARPDSQAYFYFLIEHQSSVDPDMPLRVLVYMTRIWERFRRLNPGTPLPAIVPLVVSHAPQGWTAPTSMAEMFHADTRQIPSLASLRPDFEFLLDDLSRFNDEEIRGRVDSAFAQLALWLLRDGRDARRLFAHLPAWGHAFGAALLAESGPEALRQLLLYIAAVTEEMRFDTFRAKLVELAPEAEEASMTIAEQLRAEGEARGIAKGRKETLQKLLGLKFGSLDAETLRRIEEADAEQLERYLERVLTAESLAGVFAD